MNMDTLDIAVWADLARRLTRALVRMNEDDFLVILVKRSGRFVQFAAQGGHGLRAEATSNAYLRGEDRLDLTAIGKLKALGWLPPTNGPAQSTPENDPEGSPNYFRDFQPNANLDQVAEMAVRTLREVFEVPSPIFLEYEAFDESGNETVCAELNLRRASRNPQAVMAELADMLLQGMRVITGLSDLDFDDDGTIGVTHGKTAISIRLTDSPATIEFRALLIREVEDSREVLAFLNDLNKRYGMIRFYLHRDGIVAACDIPAAPFIAEHVVGTMQNFVHVTDGIGEFLESLRAHGVAVGTELASGGKH